MKYTVSALSVVFVSIVAVTISEAKVPKCGVRNVCDWSVWQETEKLGIAEITRKVIESLKCELRAECTDAKDTCCPLRRMSGITTAVVTNAAVLKYAPQTLDDALSATKDTELAKWLRIASVASGHLKHLSFVAEMALDVREQCEVRQAALVSLSFNGQYPKEDTEKLLPIFYDSKCEPQQYFRKSLGAMIEKLGYRVRTSGNPFGGTLDFEILQYPDGRPFDKSVFLKKKM
ncbi:MAG: hypothetical protein PHR35_20315 [Kiritimatiellae bacterium]|nr:hypothetical protein [Kiritimatiellia bacterium]